MHACVNKLYLLTMCQTQILTDLRWINTLTAAHPHDRSSLSPSLSWARAGSVAVTNNPPPTPPSQRLNTRRFVSSPQHSLRGPPRQLSCDVDTGIWPLLSWNLSLPTSRMGERKYGEPSPTLAASPETCCFFSPSCHREQVPWPQPNCKGGWEKEGGHGCAGNSDFPCQSPPSFCNPLSLWDVPGQIWQSPVSESTNHKGFLSLFVHSLSKQWGCSDRSFNSLSMRRSKRTFR